MVKKAAPLTGRKIKHLAGEALARPACSRPLRFVKLGGSLLAHMEPCKPIKTAAKKTKTT
jgi:hypothetical protein